MRFWPLLLILTLPAVSQGGDEKARTEGTFRLTYELVRKDGVIVPEKLQIKVSNRQTYFHAPDARLKEHEAVHAKINENAARRMELSLRTFKSTGTMAQAERALKKRFGEEVQNARQLHGEWDETSVFVKPEDR